jgi:hypothetical protein
MEIRFLKPDKIGVLPSRALHPRDYTAFSHGLLAIGKQIILNGQQ